MWVKNFWAVLLTAIVVLQVVFAFAVRFGRERIWYECIECVEKKVAFDVMLFEFVKRLQYTLRISNKLRSERHSRTCYLAATIFSNSSSSIRATNAGWIAYIIYPIHWKYDGTQFDFKHFDAHSHSVLMYGIYLVWNVSSVCHLFKSFRSWAEMAI